MANNTLGTGVLVLKANATQLEQGLDKAAAKTKQFDKSTSAAGGGFKALAVGAAAATAAIYATARAIQSMAKAVQELAKEQRESLKLVTDGASMQEARKLRLFGSDEDIARLQEADKTINGIEQSWKEMKGALGTLGTEWLSDIGETLGLGKIRQFDVGAIEEWKKKQAEAKSAQEALTKSISAMDAELTKQAATIGQTAAEVKLYDLAIKNVDVSKFRARMLANDVKVFEVELRKTISTMGMTADQIKRIELAQRGANSQTLLAIDMLIAQKENMDRLNESMSLVVQNPLEEFQDKMKRLEELFDRGRINFDQFARSVDKVTDEFQALNKEAEKVANVPGGVPALRQGSREAIEFLINARAAHRSSDPGAQLRDALKRDEVHQKQIADATKEMPGLLREIVGKLNVETVDIP